MGSLIISILLSTITFGSPVHYPIELAGNFGEPRPNHFHGGIDVKTERGVGKGLYSIADGYIVGASVGLYGYGNALYIQHPNGYTSYWFHLKRFSPEIEMAVRRWQYEHHVSNCHAHFRPGQYPVQKGQFVAFSGNTGASQAPHLHLEIHRTSDGAMMDPLQFLGHHVKDHTPPEVLSFMAYPQPGEGSFNNRTDKQIYGFYRSKFTAWGKVGFGVRANDHMDGIYNNLGIRYQRLYVDGRLIFKSDVNGIPMEMNRQVNSWGDYDYFVRWRIWYMKSFIDPGNTLPILQANKSRGIVNFNQQRDYHLKYVLTDIYGNSTTKEFTVHGTPTKLSGIRKTDPSKTLYWNRDNTYELSGMKLSVPKGMMAGDILLKPAIKGGVYSDIYSFLDKSLQFFDYTKISIKVKRMPANPNKLYVAFSTPMAGSAARVTYLGGEYKDGWVTGKMRDLGQNYYLAYDNQGPQIQMASTHPRSMRFLATDNGSGLKSVEAYLDGKFILFEYVGKSKILQCDMADTPIAQTGRNRQLQIVAVDNRNNKSTYTANIKW